MANNGGLNGVQKSASGEVVVATNIATCRKSELVLRGLAMLLTLGAAIVLGLDKQTRIVPVQISPDVPPIMMPVVAKYHYASAYVYSVVANSIASGFAAISLALAITSKGGRSSVSNMVIYVADLVMISLLFSSIGAASGVGLIGLKGNSHLQWNKVCNVYGKFCHKVFASVVLSLLGAQTFLLLVIINVWKLQKKS